VNRSKTGTRLLASRAVWGAIIFTLALALRLGFVWETLDRPTFRTPTPGLDIHVHWQAAKAMNDGASTASPHFELMLPSAPLLVHWLAFWHRVLGDESVTPHRIVNAVLGALNAALVYLLLCTLLGGTSPVAVGAALVWAGLPSLIFFDTALHKSVLSIFMLLVLLLVISRRTRPTSRIALACEGGALGLLLGLLFLCQLNTFLFIVAVVPVLIFDREVAGWNKAWRALPVLLVFAAIFSMFQFRNEIWDQKFPWYLPQKGIHLRIGNQASSTGGYRPYKQIARYPFGHVFQARLYAETVLGRRQSPWEADRLLTDEAVQFVRDNPLQSLDIATRKILRFFNDFEQKGVDSLYQIETYSKILASDPLGLGILVLFSGLGVIRLVVENRVRLLYLLLSLLSSVLISNLMTFMTWRYRLLALVPLVLLAGLGASLLWKVVQTVATERSIRPRSTLIAAMLVALLACGWLTYRPEFEQVEAKQVEVASRNEAASLRAETRSAKLKLLESRVPSRRVELAEAGLLFKLHRFTQALDLYTEVDPCKPPTGESSGCSSYSRLLIWLGDYERVAQALRTLRSRDSNGYDKAVAELTKLEGEVFQLFIRPRVEGATP
jgi:hypothetical protein